VFQYHRLRQQAADTTSSLAEAAAASDGGTVDVDVVDVAVASGTSGSASTGPTTTDWTTMLALGDHERQRQHRTHHHGVDHHSGTS